MQITLDCLGEICPVPIMRLQKLLNTARPGQEVMLVTDHSCVPPSVQGFCKKKGLAVQTDEVMNGVWEICIRIPEKAAC